MTETTLDKHIVITGGGSGIGAAIAERVAKMGARITLMGRNEERLQTKATTLPQAVAIPVDITDPNQVKQAFDTAIQQFGSVDILINNAGVAKSASFLKIDSTDWNEMLAVNLTGAFLCTQASLPGMKKQQWGRIIFIASTAGLKGYPYVAAYCAAKHGVIGMTRALALETARLGITVNAICPGYTETDIVQNSISNIVNKTGRSFEEARAELVAGNPQKRLIQPDEIANTVAWLCHENSGSITGQAIAVAGGEVMG